MEGKELYRTRQQRRSLGQVVALDPPERPSVDPEIIISAIAQFLPLEEIFEKYLYLIYFLFYKYNYFLQLLVIQAYQIL